MQKIISGSEVKQLDATYIQDKQINSFELMERAAQSFCSWFTGRYGKEQTIAVFCVMGNNGGDGLAISRLLFCMGYKVRTFTVGDFAKASVDFKKNLDILP